MKHGLTPNTIIGELESRKEELAVYGVKRIGLFGSFLKGSGRKESDLDFLVLFDASTFDKYFELKFLLEKLFHRKVDLVLEDSLKPAVEYVKKEALYAKANFISA
ncbi:MAG: nucleotidyltransferase domain-containing protein [Candidatus Diapherotrites archaeon]